MTTGAAARAGVSGRHVSGTAQGKEEPLGETEQNVGQAGNLQVQVNQQTFVYKHPLYKLYADSVVAGQIFFSVYCTVFTIYNKTVAFTGHDPNKDLTQLFTVLYVSLNVFVI